MSGHGKSKHGAAQKGVPLGEQFITHTWLVIAGLLVLLLGCAARRAEHHHAGGTGLKSLLVAYGGAMIFYYMRYLLQGKLSDRSLTLTNWWERLTMVLPPATAILLWSSGKPAGIGIAGASVVYFAIAVIQILLAEPIKKTPSRERESASTESTEDTEDGEDTEESADTEDIEDGE